MRLTATFVVRLFSALLIGTAAFGLFNNVLRIGGAPLLGQPTAVPEVGSTLRFVIVAPHADHPYWAQVRQGALTVGQTINVHVDFTGPHRASVEEQARLINAATAAQVDGIITQGVDHLLVELAITKAVNRGIPVITVDTDSAGPRLAYVGSDNYQAGRRAAEALITQTGGIALVGIVRGGLGPVETDQRVLGFRDGIASAPGVRIAAVESSDMTRTAAGQQALRIRQQHPDVNVFYGTTALDAVGIVQSLSRQGVRDRLLVIGWDDFWETKDPYWQEFDRFVLHQQPEAMGSKAVQLLEAYLRRDRRPSPVHHLPVELRGGAQP